LVLIAITTAAAKLGAPGGEKAKRAAKKSSPYKVFRVSFRAWVTCLRLRV
jgi:hypothetical protein